MPRNKTPIPKVEVGGINPKVVLGMGVKILGKNGTLKGVIGVRPKEKIEVKDIFIDCGSTSKDEIDKIVCIGDYVIYNRSYDYLLNDRIVGRGLDNRTGAFIVAEVLRRISDKNPNIAVYAVSIVNEETNMGGAYFAASAIQLYIRHCL